jgi:hypothetical protein
MLHSFLQRLFVSNISWLQDWLQDCGVLEIKNPGFLQGPFWF